MQFLLLCPESLQWDHKVLTEGRAGCCGWVIAAKQLPIRDCHYMNNSFGSAIFSHHCPADNSFFQLCYSNLVTDYINWTGELIYFKKILIRFKKIERKKTYLLLLALESASSCAGVSQQLPNPLKKTFLSFCVMMSHLGIGLHSYRPSLPNYRNGKWNLWTGCCTQPARMSHLAC